MPIYEYHHEDCGMDQQIHLNIDKNTMVVTCYRCGRNVTARQIRDKSIKEGEADGVVGLLRQNDRGRKQG